MNWVRSPYSDVADTIGLTAAKLAKGQSACGISGTYTSDGTVSASHVLKDKVCYSNGSRIVGTMNSISPTTGDKLNATGVTTDSSYTYFGVTSNSYLNGVSYIRAANSTIASKVGLTSDILASGKTVLGVSGSLQEQAYISTYYYQAVTRQEGVTYNNGYYYGTYTYTCSKKIKMFALAATYNYGHALIIWIPGYGYQKNVGYWNDFNNSWYTQPSTLSHTFTSNGDGTCAVSLSSDYKTVTVGFSSFYYYDYNSLNFQVYY